MLEIVVHEIRGKCVVHKIGDKIVIDGPRIVLERTDALCIHVLPTLLHYALILEHKWCVSCGVWIDHTQGPRLCIYAMC